jgi:hypothetical protein
VHQTNPLQYGKTILGMLQLRVGKQEMASMLEGLPHVGMGSLNKFSKLFLAFPESGSFVVLKSTLIVLLANSTLKVHQSNNLPIEYLVKNGCRYIYLKVQCYMISYTMIHETSKTTTRAVKRSKKTKVKNCRF